MFITPQTRLFTTEDTENTEVKVSKTFTPQGHEGHEGKKIEGVGRLQAGNCTAKKWANRN
jgi:hypothetical protein